MLLVLLNVVAVVVESEHQLYEAYQVYFDGFEIFSVAVFTLEYGLRLWVCVESSDKALQHSLRGRWRYVYSPMALIDLLAILPFYLSFFFGVSDWRVLRSLRLLRYSFNTKYFQ